MSKTKKRNPAKIARTNSLRSQSGLAIQPDWIVVNTSAGKDSQAMLSHVVRMATAWGLLDRVVAIHVDLGRMEWEGTTELAQAQCDHFGIPLTVVTKEGGDTANDLIDRVIERGAFPDAARRWCTSDFKRGPARKFFTSLARQWKAANPTEAKTRPCRILSAMGLRAEESPDRANRSKIAPSEVTTSNQVVYDWLPIQDWSEERVWDEIHASGAPYHFAYDLGMSRLSCVACVLASKADLELSARHNPEVFAAIAEAEEITGHTFKNGWSITEAIDAAAETPVTIGG